MNTYTTHWWITLAWLCIAATMQSIAQTTEPDAPIRGWGFDEFHIGGEEIYNPSICRNSLNMDFTYHYGGYSSWTYMDDPVRHANDRNTHRLDRFFSMAKQAQAVGLKLIYAVDTTFFMQKNIRSYDWYYDSRSDTVDIKDFRDRLDSSNAAVDSVYWIPNRFIAGVAVSRSGSSTADSLFTMGAPRFTQLVTTRGNGLYYTNYLKVPDSSMWFDFRVMLKIQGEEDSIFNDLANDAPLAYLDVIRRVVVSRDASCDSCRCPFYVRIAHLPITKQMYIGQTQLSYDHKQFTFLMNLLDTSRSDGQVYGQEHLGYPSPTYSDTLSRCDSVLALWKQQGIVPPATFRRLTNSGDGANVLEQGDLHFNITSTRLVPLQVLGGSISQHIFDYLDRPQRYSTSYRMDSLIFSQLDTLANDDTLWPMMAYMALWDEPIGIDHNAYRIITSKIQRRIRELHPTDQTKWRG
ncbi:MAG: hypothetical protein JNJ94_16045, partial [Chlorobi bacterium]|nr:hypothetical protein [Chlorobiota bacterium]